MNFLRLVYNEKVIQDLYSRLKVDEVPHLEFRTVDLKQCITKKAISHMKKANSGAIIGWKSLHSELDDGDRMPSFFSKEWLTYVEDNDNEGNDNEDHRQRQH